MKPIRPILLGAAIALAPLAIATAADAPVAGRPAHNRYHAGAAMHALLRRLDLSTDQQACRYPE